MPRAGPVVDLVAEHRLQRQDFAGLGVLKQAATDWERLQRMAFQNDQWSTVDRCTSINFTGRPQREPLALEIIRQFTSNSTQFSLWISQPVLKSPEITLKYYINLQQYTVYYTPAVTRNHQHKGSEQKKSGKQRKACWDSSWYIINIFWWRSNDQMISNEFKWYDSHYAENLTEQPLTFGEAMALQ